MKQVLVELWAFGRRPRHARYVLLVAAAAYTIMLCHWDVRHNAASRRFVFANELRSKEWRSLARNSAGHVLGALALWTAAGIVGARRRREPLEAALSRTALAFSPGLLAGLGIATNLLGCEKHLAAAIEALAATGMAAWLWTELDLWPCRTGWQPVLPFHDRKQFYARILATAALAYALLFSWLCIARYMTYYAAIDDLGLYTQQLWGNLRGRWFLCSTYELPNDTMLAEHFMPLVLFLTPLYAIWQDPRMILIVQAVGVALAAVPLYGIAVRLGLDRRAGLFFAGSYLLHPLLQTATLYDFHPDAFVPLFATGAFWALLEIDHALRGGQDRARGQVSLPPGGDRGRVPWRCGIAEQVPLPPGGGRGRVPWRYGIAYALFVLLWLSYKEDSMFGVVLLGFYAMAFRRRWFLGLTTMAVGAAWGVVAMGVIIPYFRGVQYSHVDRYYHLLEPFGWTPDQGSFFAAFVKTAVLHPLSMIGVVLDEHRILALLKLFGPVAFLSFFGPKELLIAVPALAFNLLSDGHEQYEFKLHYPFGMMPFVYVSALVGVRNLAAWIGHPPYGGRREEGHEGVARPAGYPSPCLVLGAAALIGALFLCRWFGETPASRSFAAEKVWRTAHHRLVDAVLRRVPDDASVAAQFGVGAHLTHRLELTRFPDLARHPEYIVLDARAPTWPLSPQEYLTTVTDLLRGGTYGVVEAGDGCVILRRGHSTARNDEARETIDRIL